MWRMNTMLISQSMSVCDMLKRAFVRAHIEEEKAKHIFFSRFGTSFAFLCFCFSVRATMSLCVSDIFYYDCTSLRTSRDLLKEL